MIRGKTCSVRRRVGDRGAALLCLGVFDFVYGWTKLINPDPVSAHSQQLQLIGQLFPMLPDHTTLLVWGYLWWLAGVFCVVNAFRRNDRWGYGAAIGIKVSWISANLIAWSHGLVGGGSTAAYWSFVLAMTVLSAIRAESVPEIDQYIDQHTGDIPRVEE